MVIKEKKQIGQQTVAQLEDQHFINDKLAIFLKIPWGHNIEIMTKIESHEERLWYANKTRENEWNRNVLMIQIQSDLYSRQAKKEFKTNNFALTLPSQTSDLADDIIKDTYNLEFIDNGSLKERALEDALIDDIIKFLTELGKGFAFVGKQYHLAVGDDDFYIDLLFYNIKLKSYFIIELKTGKFKPEYVGKMAFYLSVVDSQLKEDSDNDSIGMILCTDKNNKVVEESIKYITKPVGVSQYQIAKDVSKKVREVLPSNKELTRLITSNNK